MKIILTDDAVILNPETELDRWAIKRIHEYAKIQKPKDDWHPENELEIITKDPLKEPAK